MKFEVVRLGLTCACEAHVLRGSGGMPPRKILYFQPSEVVFNAIFE